MKILIGLIILVVALDCTMAKKSICKGSKKAVCARLKEVTEGNATCAAENLKLNNQVVSLEQENKALKEELEKLKSPQGLSCNTCNWVEDPADCEPSECIAEHTVCISMNDKGFYLKACRSPEGVENDKKMCDSDHGCELTTCSKSNCN